MLPFVKRDNPVNPKIVFKKKNKTTNTTNQTTKQKINIT